MGSIEDTSSYSVPKETEQILYREILSNNLLPSLPKGIEEAVKHVTFTGNDLPSIPINWRFTESVSALKGFEAAMLNVLRARKYADTGATVSDVTINTDHASLFIMSPVISQFIDAEDGGKVKPVNISGDPNVLKRLGIPNTDLHRLGSTLHRTLATNIYKTKDGRFYHAHGSMNPEPTLTVLGMPLDAPAGEKEDYDAIAKGFQESVGKWEAGELDRVMNEEYRQAGTICYSTEEYFNTEHGKANAQVGLYEITKAKTGKEFGEQPQGWWPEQSSMPSSAQRPLAGLKVVDLTRVIAAPTVTRSLAEMGASVMRVTSPLVTDMAGLHHDLNWGKWNTHLHLKTPSDREKLLALILEADVVVEGYRPSVMEKYGLGRDDIFRLVASRDRGIIHVRENCYGWHGPWSYRSGWQQISDAVCGISTSYGRAMGVEGAVTPVFPNSDYCTGIIGSAAVLHALMRRAEEGGSWGVDVSLNYYSQWLARSVGAYPDAVWQDLWQRHGSLTFENWHSMHYTIPKMLGALRQHDNDVLFNKEFFEQRTSKALGHTFIQVKPVARWKDGAVKLGYNVGTRGNGKDQPYWPRNLTTEVVV